MSNCGGNEHHNKCGNFHEPDNPDSGICAPYRLKVSCEAPDLPEPACDEEYTTEYNPDSILSPFTIIAHLYDQACNLILDENSASITTPLN